MRSGDDDDASDQRRHEGGGDLVGGDVERCTNSSGRLVSVELDPAGEQEHDGGERPRQAAVGSKVGGQHRYEIGIGSQILEHGTRTFRARGQRRKTLGTPLTCDAWRVPDENRPWVRESGGTCRGVVQHSTSAGRHYPKIW